MSDVFDPTNMKECDVKKFKKEILKYQQMLGGLFSGNDIVKYNKITEEDLKKISSVQIKEIIKKLNSSLSKRGGSQDGGDGAVFPFVLFVVAGSVIILGMLKKVYTDRIEGMRLRNLRNNLQLSRQPTRRHTRRRSREPMSAQERAVRSLHRYQQTAENGQNSQQHSPGEEKTSHQTGLPLNWRQNGEEKGPGHN